MPLDGLVTERSPGFGPTPYPLPKQLLSCLGDREPRRGWKGEKEDRGGAASPEDQESWAVPLGLSLRTGLGVTPRAVP